MILRPQWHIPDQNVVKCTPLGLSCGRFVLVFCIGRASWLLEELASKVIDRLYGDDRVRAGL